MLAVGDTIAFDGKTGTVQAVVSTTDANGRGSASYGGNTFSFRALKATVSGTDFPLVATADAVFRVGVVQQEANPLMRRGSIAILSGCGWGCCGGAQRPVALAREFARLGFEVGYYSTVGRSTFVSPEGVSIFASADWVQVLEWARGIELGWVILTLAPYLVGARELKALGWRICYDLLDDWTGMTERGDLWPGALDLERALFAEADALTCSTPFLQQRAVGFGRGDGALILNGGPPGPLPRCEPPEDFLPGDVTAVYSGYLQGSWFDWQCLMRLGEAGLPVTVVGNILTDPEIANVRFVGEKPYPEAMRYVVNADAGLVPFKHPEICRAVDPIKAYDHWAAGQWVVATPELEALRERPFVLFARPDEFPEAVREAAERRKTEAPDAEFVSANCWARRVEQFANLFVAADRDWPAWVPLTVPNYLRPRTNLCEQDCQLRLTWQAPTVCNMEPPCPYCNNAHERSGKPRNQPGTAEQWIAAFEELGAQTGGPLYLSICYGEPMANRKTIDVACSVGRWSKVDLVTNLKAFVSVYARLPGNGNVALCTSFHPEAWPSLTTFLDKRDAIAELGIRVGVVQVVAWPPYLNKLDAWGAECAARGVAFGVIPFWGEWEGRCYPDAYEAGTERWQVDPAAGRCGDRWFGKPCRAGKDYLYLGWDGRAYRCVMPSACLGNVLRGEPVRLLSSAEPCPSERCPCPDLWRFQVVE